jgi:hypothetical protein
MSTEKVDFLILKLFLSSNCKEEFDRNEREIVHSRERKGRDRTTSLFIRITLAVRTFWQRYQIQLFLMAPERVSTRAWRMDNRLLIWQSKDTD